MSESLKSKCHDYTVTTITFDRHKLYDPTKGAHDCTNTELATGSLRNLLGLITTIQRQPDHLETLQALQEYGVTVHDHYRSANGTDMFGPVPAADAELS